MERESCGKGTIIGELHSLDIQGDQRVGESRVTRSNIYELHSWVIQVDQIEGASSVAQSIIDELHSWDI